MSGIGIDIVSVKKLERIVKKWGLSFLQRVFSQEELDSVKKNLMYYQRLAARFAAKEAVIKALRKSELPDLRDITILNLPSGAPVCKLKNSPDLNVLISISHIEEYAVATALIVDK